MKIYSVQKETQSFDVSIMYFQSLSDSKDLSFI